jgi:hypothetical protein
MDLGFLINNLVSSGSLFLFLLKPALLNGGRLAASSLALNLNFLGLVGAQFIGKARLFGGLGSSGSAELLDVGLSIAGLDGGRLVGTEFTEVEFLDRVGCRMLEFVVSYESSTAAANKIIGDRRAG